MNPRIAFPFLVLPGEAVHADHLMIGSPGEPLQPAGDLLEHWDYARDLEVHAGLEIDFAAAASALEIPADKLELRLALLAGTGQGFLPRRTDTIAECAVNNETGKKRVVGTVPGHNLSGRLKLSISVTLAKAVDCGSALSPRDRGSRLWQLDHDILIEDGGDSRFPVEAVSFAEAFAGKPHSSAPWYLFWRAGDLEGDFSACVRLYVNSDHPTLLDRFAEGDSPTLQAMLGDAMSQMLDSAMALDDAEELLEECEEGSVGRQIRRWLEHSFPVMRLDEVRALRARSPGSYRAAILQQRTWGTDLHGGPVASPSRQARRVLDS